MTDTLAVFADQVPPAWPGKSVSKDGWWPGPRAGRRRYVARPHDNVNQLSATLTPRCAPSQKWPPLSRRATHAVDRGRGQRRGRRPQGQHQRDDRNLKVTTERNQEQDWLKTNLARFTRMLQGQRTR